MRYVIYGAGAIGGAIGARLFQHGHHVVLIARGPHLDAMRDHGLRFETPAETLDLRVPVAAHPRELTFGEGDVVLLTMKSQHTQAALDDLRAAAGPDVPVVCAQNGVDNERMALRRFAHVYAMLVILPATYLQPGTVQAHAAPVGGILDAGCYPSGVDHLIARVTADLDAAGFSARPVADVMRWKYAKLLSNLGNAVQAVCGLDGDAARVHARLRDEAIACYAAAGIPWASDAEMAERRRAMSRPAAIAGETRAGGSSWQSVARGAGSIETDYLNGEIALFGRLHGVPTPANAALQLAATRILREAAPPGSMTVREVEALIP
ncbi:MAG TPA: 2-dehydropantoate 2-reductase N-terminal domain-containing protein [Dehalococcoidia bacterium]|nr:2-dehydropantoate 2-reductase N-terminal domain-containing protein [Dehalococcoidia bacterium]